MSSHDLDNERRIELIVPLVVFCYIYEEYRKYLSYFDYFVAAAAD